MNKDILNSKYKGSIKGRRIYQEKRGIWHVQDVVVPSMAIFTGTLKEIEKALGGKLTRIN